MRRDIRSKTCSLGATSDLTIVAPIRPGLVPALDTVTYKSRVKRVLRALHLGRAAAHEYDLARVLSDAVERVGRIHSVRIAVLEPQDQVLLAVTFDGAWESYVRVIWQKVARLLDLIFCNTVDYVPGWSSSFEQWGRWLRSRQAETSFLYAPPGLTVDDVQYLRMHERLHRRDGGADRRLAGVVVPTAEETADRLMIEGQDPTNLGESDDIHEMAQAKPPAFRQGLRSMVGLYRLADLYPPGTLEGGWLLRAAHELLPEFSRLVHGHEMYGPGLGRVEDDPRLREVLAWFRQGLGSPQPGKQLRLPPDEPALVAAETIQGGILTPHPDASHGVLLLLAFASREALGAFTQAFHPTIHAVPPDPGMIAANLAFTLEGLRLAGLSDDEVERLPEEFVQGMQARAGLLGDVHVNHPRRWRLPARNWDQGIASADLTEDDPTPRIDLSAVHALVQLRLGIPSDGKPPPSQDEGRAALMTYLQARVAVHAGVLPLSLQWMHRLRDAATGSAVEHFGFGDGHSDPVLRQAQAGRLFKNHVHAGEALVGYENAADAASPVPAPGSVAELLYNGSFLVVRKLRQDLGLLEDVIDAAYAIIDRTTLLGKMMGRWPGGHADEHLPLVGVRDRAKPNDFLYGNDPAGALCPLQAHIRRANPRTVVPADLQAAMTDGSRPPRIFRRGMSYGAPFDPHSAGEARAAGLAAERGLVFMAYNASLGEQFEVVQGWLAGGNSSGGYSGASDPFLGVAEPGRRRYFRFDHCGAVRRVALDGSDELHAEPRPLVRLEWGGYFFAPSTRALALIAQRAAGAPPPGAARPVPWSATRGLRLIDRLQDIEAEADPARARLAWKAALEDPEAAADYDTASIWAAIRENHGGVLRTPYGVLVASDALVGDVLRDTGTHLTATGYLPRMRPSFGEIFLGMDDGAPYKLESGPCNGAIEGLDPQETCNIARECTRSEITRRITDAIRHAREDEDVRREVGVPPQASLRWDVTIDLRALVDHLLATLCEQWFGLSEDGRHFERGGYSWTWQADQPPRYPGHFMAPSRYFFQPHPEAEVARIGIAHGQALQSAMARFLADQGAQLTQPIVRSVLASEAAQQDAGYAARTLVGAIMGFVPTIDGSLRRLLVEWLRDGSFWSLRTQFDRAGEHRWEAALDAVVERTMQLRAMPDAIWRTARTAHRIGDEEHGVDVLAGEVVVLGSVSATQQRLQAGRGGLESVFGGARGTPGGHPTHACPGRYAAMAAIKGFLIELVASDLPLQAGVAPLTLTIRGTEPYPVEITDDRRLAARRTRFTEAAAFTRSVPMLAIGDSWLTRLEQWGVDYYPDLVTELDDLGYVAAELRHPQLAGIGRTLVEMATPAKLDELERLLLDPPSELRGVRFPRAILLGGGGNDIVQPEDRPSNTPLFRLLVQGATSPEAALNEREVTRFIDGELRGHYVKILDKLTGAFDGPILLHAYDHPIPDGRDALRVGGPWLRHVFKAAFITDERGVMRPVMRVLIDRLDAVVASLAGDYQAQGRAVHHIGFAGVLEKEPDFVRNYKLFWNDELHLTDRGYRIVARVVAAKLAALGIVPQR